MTSAPVVLLIGGSSQLGKTISQHLTDLNYRVYSSFLSHPILASPNLTPILLDITKLSSCQKAIQTILAKEGQIDILINAAGITSQNLEETLQVNTIGPYHLMREVIPHMKKRNSGQIINITSLSGLVSFPGFGPYSASKFALTALTSAAHYELENYNIRVTNLACGAILNPHIPLPPNSARARLWPLRILLPFLPPEKIARKILSIIKHKKSQPLVLIGVDAHLIYFLNRFLPQPIWHGLQHFVWRYQQ